MPDLSSPDDPLPPRAWSRRNFLRIGFAAGASTLMGAMLHSSEKPHTPPPPAPPPPPKILPFKETRHFFADIHADARRAIPRPRNGVFLRLEDLTALPEPRLLDHPAEAQAPGGRKHPIVLSWEAGIDASRLLVDNAAGALSYDGRILLRWPVNSSHGSWMHDDAGVHLWGGARPATDARTLIEALLPPPIDSTQIPLPDSVTVREDTLTAMPGDLAAPIESAAPVLENPLPLSVAARRSHPFHHRYLYVPSKNKADARSNWGDTKHLLPLLEKGDGPGHFHDLSSPPPDVAETSLAMTEWKYRRAAESMWNILHWRPDDPHYPMRANYAPLAVARVESAHNDLPGPDNWEVNRLGYGGWFQPQINRPNKPALVDAGLVDRKGVWLNVEINEVPVRNRGDYLADWRAQMVFFWSYLGSIKPTLAESVACYRENATAISAAPEGTAPRLVHPEMTDQTHVSFFGACMGGFLTGPSTAVRYLQTGEYARDANGTSTEYYAKYFSPVTEDLFVVPAQNLNPATKHFIAEYFSPEGEPRRLYVPPPVPPSAHEETSSAEPQETEARWRRAVKPDAKDSSRIDSLLRQVLAKAAHAK